MICVGFVGSAMENDQQKWAFFCLSLLLFCYIVSVLVKNMTAERYGSDAATLYMQVSWIVIISWALYPLAYLLYSTFDIIDVKTADIICTVLDLISQAYLGIVILTSYEAINQILNMQSGYNEIPFEQYETMA